MSQCHNSYGRPKVKHPNKEEAMRHVSSHMKHYGGLPVNAYKCKVCPYWHIGRIPAKMELAKIMKSIDVREDMMVGKLIIALRNVIKENSNV